MKLDGHTDPADAVRQEIDRLRKEAQGITESEPPEEQESETEPEDEVGTSEDEELEEAEEVESSSFESSDKVPREETVEYWKHRFEVVQGQQRAEAQQAKARISLLEAELETLRNLVARQSSTGQAESVDDALDNLEAEYGEEFTRAMDARIRRIVDSRVNDVMSKLSHVETSQKVTEQSLFDQSISSIVPNWQALNFDKGFISWLDSNHEPYSGMSYRELLQRAYDARDLSTTVKFFQDYEALKQKTKTKQTPNAPQQHAMVAPPRRGSSANTIVDSNEGRVYSMSEIQQFYKDLQLGKYRGKDEYVRKMKEEFMRANAEGRVV